MNESEESISRRAFLHFFSISVPAGAKRERNFLPSEQHVFLYAVVLASSSLIRHQQRSLLRALGAESPGENNLRACSFNGNDTLNRMDVFDSPVVYALTMALAPAPASVSPALVALVIVVARRPVLILSQSLPRRQLSLGALNDESTYSGGSYLSMRTTVMN